MNMKKSPQKLSSQKVKKISEEVKKNPEVQKVLEVAKLSQQSERSILQELEKTYPNFYKV